MATNGHPIDPLLAQLKGVRRVLLSDLQEMPAKTPLKVTVIFAATVGLPRPTVLSSDLDLFFVSGGASLRCPPYMPRYMREVIEPAIRIGFGETQSPYVLGAEPCQCPPELGGPLWNPLCVALKWAPALGPTAIQWLVPEWWDIIQHKQERFCRRGIALMRYLGLV